MFIVILARLLQVYLINKLRVGEKVENEIRKRKGYSFIRNYE
jgi:hypothetical protein